jgi:hypothetical protein
MSSANQSATKRPDSGEIGDFGQASSARRKSDLKLPMNERLARVHALSKQMSAIKGAARVH